MQDLVHKYGGIAALKKIIETFYERVCKERGLMHYFFSVPLVQIMADQLTYPHYIMRKPDIDYRSTPKQTGVQEIRIALFVFEDVIKLLHVVLSDAKVHRNDAPRMATHIIELIEETRSRAADTKKAFYKPAEISTPALLTFYRSQTIEAKLDEPTGEIRTMVMQGLAYPMSTLFNERESSIHLICRALAKESVEVNDVQPIVMAASTKVPPIHFSTYADENGIAVFEGRYQISTKFGVPKRLLQRVTNNFTWRFEEAFKVDEQQLLINVVAPDKNSALMGYD
jgi:hypothetical protein